MKRETLFFGFLMVVSPLGAVDTIIKGGRMELINKGEEVVFSGGVRLTRGEDTIIADKMTTDKNREKIRAFGDVKVHRHLEDGEEWQAFGREGFYNSKSGDGYLLGNRKKAHLIYTQVLSSTSTRKVDIFANEVYFSDKQKDATAKGDVYGKSIDPNSAETYEFWSDAAHYDQIEEKITLTGEEQPKVRQYLGKEEKIINGDVIYYFVNEERFISEGNAVAVFVSAPKEN